MQKTADNRKEQGGILRLALTTWLGVWTVLTLISVVLEPLLEPMPVMVRTLVLSGIMVPVMIFGVMPMINRFWSFSSLQPHSRS